MAGPGDDIRARNAAFAVVAVATVVRLVFASALPLYPDEAYYWEWSRRLAPGYFDHPPGIAYIIGLGTSLFPALGLAVTPFAVRVFAVLCGLVASLAVVGIARRLGGDRAGVYAALIICTMPLAATGLVLATPDAPLMGATGAGMYAVVRAVQSPLRSRASLGWWCAAGLALGAAFTSKYTSILLPVGVVGAIVGAGELRSRLREPGPYVACAVATLVFAPVLVWNAAHEWRSFTFQIEHGLGAHRGSPLAREGELVGGQAGLATPILFVLMAAAAWQAIRRRVPATFALLGIVAAVMWGFFVLSAWRKPVEANWPAPAYVPAAALLAATAATMWRARGRRWTRWGIGLALGLTTVVYAHALFNVLPLVPRRDPIARAFGFDAMAAGMDAARAARRASATAAGATGTVWLGVDRYQDAAEAAFNLPDRPEVFSVNLGGRPNQYDFWPGFPDRARPGDDLVLAVDDPEGEVHAAVRRLSPHFARVVRGGRVELKRDEGDPPISVRRIWTLEGWNGTWPARPQP
ncbi:MAG: glycosyltransferase family 39 protein [Gemmatimonadaceae bacterium]|nr:glycosyltransferase family 39 protein [Gemmatimonadaceae bacterium]